MTKSDSTLERLKHAGGEPVTWKGLAQTGLVVGSLVSGIWLARESSQDAAIAAKADEAEIARSLDRVEARMERLAADLTTLFMKFIKVAEANAVQNEPPHVIGQVQTQELHVTDMIGEAIREDFESRRRFAMKQYPPCMTGDIDGLQQPGTAVAGQEPAACGGAGEKAGGRCGTVSRGDFSTGLPDGGG